MKEAEEISSSRRMNTLTLNRHTEILEILEIPQLMDTCVRNSYYEEALELAAYVRRLEKKYSSIPVIQVAGLLKGAHTDVLVVILRSSLNLEAETLHMVHISCCQPARLEHEHTFIHWFN